MRRNMVILFAAGAGLVAFFVLRNRRVKLPLNLALIKSPRATPANFAELTTGYTLGASKVAANPVPGGTLTGKLPLIGVSTSRPSSH